MSDRVNNSFLWLDKVSLAASIGSTFLLDDISFQVNQGDIVAVVGASGAGKTSLLRVLNRLRTPSQGEIYFQATSFTKIPVIELRRQIVLIPQEPKLLGMNGRDALSYPLQLQKLSTAEINQRIDTWTSLLHIPPGWLEKNELQLSLGQRQLLAIARALVMQPPILLLDEPTSALDIGLAQNLLTVLRNSNQENNLTIIMVNHQLELIQNFCDRILFLNNGKLAKDLPATATLWEQIRQQLLQAQQDLEKEWLEN
jgi:D-methionine transport system ATP-binding protein